MVIKTENWRTDNRHYNGQKEMRQSKRTKYELQKTKERTQVLRKGQYFLLQIWQPPCYIQTTRALSDMEFKNIIITSIYILMECQHNNNLRLHNAFCFSASKCNMSYINMVNKIIYYFADNYQFWNNCISIFNFTCKIAK